MPLTDLLKASLHLTQGRRLDVPPIDMYHAQSTLARSVVSEDETDVGLATPLHHDRKHRRLQAVARWGVWLAGASQHASQPVPHLRGGHRAITPSALGRRGRGLSTAPRETMGSPASSHANEVFAPRALSDSLERRYEQKENPMALPVRRILWANVATSKKPVPGTSPWSTITEWTSARSLALALA